MTLKHLLLNPEVNGDNGNGTTTITPPSQVAAPKSTTPAPFKPAQQRQPTATEKAQKFEILPGDSGFIDSIELEQLPQRTIAPVVIPPTKEENVAPVKKEVVVPVKEEVAKVEPKKEEDGIPSILKPPTGTVKPVETKVAPEVKPISPTDVKGRDYSGFDQEEVKVLKQMSNEAFVVAAKAIKENKELKSTQYLQHPNAFVLDPQFQKLNEDVDFFNKESDYWREQLMAIKDGKDWFPFQNFDKQGNPIPMAARKASPQDEEWVRQAMTQSQGLAQQTQAQIQQVSQNYGSRVKQDLQAIEQERSRRFAWASKPEILDYTVPVEGKGDISIKALREDFINMWPPYLKNNPGVQVSADMFAAMIIQGAQLKEAQSGKQVAEIKQQEMARVEPSSDLQPAPESKAGGRSFNGVKTFSVDPSVTI